MKKVSCILTPLLLAVAALSSLTAGAPARRFELLAESPQFWKLLDHHAQLTTVATGFGFTEGPVWDPSGFLYVSDEEINKIFRVYLADGRKEEVLSLGDPDGNTYDRERHLLDCASVLRAIIQVEPQGHYQILADRYQGKRFNSPNDVIIGPDGALANGRMFGEEPGGKGDGVPDGIKIDKHGNLYVTGPKGIWVWDEQGHHLGTIAMPEQPANLAWGDADYGTLYITATTSVYRLPTKTHGFVPYLPTSK